MPVQLDWKSYFKAFDLYHGGEPVHLGQYRLLYRDGWQYGINSYSGPEWGPPRKQDETGAWVIDESRLKRLQIVYWRKRKHSLVDAVNEQRIDLNSLAALQEGRSAPLQAFVTNYDDDGGKYLETRVVDLNELRQQLAATEAQILDCDTKLLELGYDESRERQIGPYRYKHGR